VLLYPQQQAAHQRNLDRTGPGATQHYLDEGIRFTYQSLGAIIPIWWRRAGWYWTQLMAMRK
jgi:hypothetical protein